MNRGQDGRGPVSVRCGGIDDRDIQDILDRLDRAEAKERYRRTHPRVPFRMCGVKLWLDHIGGSQSLITVWTRNLSAGGLSVLHGAFVHPGSRCRVMLPRHDSSIQEVTGVVRWCRLLQGIVHEFGIKFEEELEMELFVNVAVLRDHVQVARPAGDPWREEPMTAAATTDAQRAELAGSARALMREIDRLIEPPNLTRATQLCSKLLEIGGALGWSELSDAATDALQSLLATNSVARSEALLRKVRRLARTMDSAIGAD